MKSDPQFSDRVGYSNYMNFKKKNLIFEKTLQLKNRTSVNLKDKYRDLLKHGRLPNIVETDDEEK